jgi:hypothetical protein
MIPRFNIKQIKNKLEGNTSWMEYIPPVLNFADDSLSLALGKYILRVEQGWNWWNLNAFENFIKFFDAQPGYQSFDEEYTGKTANVLEFDDNETIGLLSATSNLFVGWSDDGSSANLVDEDGHEIGSSDVIVDKSHIKMGESKDGTLLASFENKVFEIKQIDRQFYAFRPVEDAVVSYKDPQDVIFVLPNYFYDSWNGNSFHAFYRIENDGWRVLDDVDWTPDMRFMFAERGPELEVMENGFIDWEEVPDFFSVEIEITAKNVAQWSDLIASMKEESESDSSLFSLEKVSDDT